MALLVCPQPLLSCGQPIIYDTNISPFVKLNYLALSLFVFIFLCPHPHPHEEGNKQDCKMGTRNWCGKGKDNEGSLTHVCRVLADKIIFLHTWLLSWDHILHRIKAQGYHSPGQVTASQSLICWYTEPVALQKVYACFQPWPGVEANLFPSHHGWPYNPPSSVISL